MKIKKLIYKKKYLCKIDEGNSSYTVLYTSTYCGYKLYSERNNQNDQGKKRKKKYLRVLHTVLHNFFNFTFIC